MTNRVFENEYFFEVSSMRGCAEFSLEKDGNMRVAVSNDRENVFWLNATEAKQLKEFLIRKGF